MGSHSVDSPDRAGADAAPESPRTDPKVARRVGLVAALASFVVFAIGLGRPAYWQDEAFTVELSRRSWYQLARLIYHTEAPLGPYYVFMKPWIEISDAEWWTRLPSALAAAVAVGLLACLVSRVLEPVAGLAAAAVMVALPGVSRYAQETRPYAFALLFAVVSAVAWWHLLRRGGLRRGVWFAVTVAALPAAHLFALTVVPAMVVASPFIVARGRRTRAVVITVAGAAAGSLVSAAFVLLSLRRAVGVAHPRLFSVDNVWLTVTEIFGSETVAIVTVILAVVGVLITVALKVSNRSVLSDDDGSRDGAAPERTGLIVFAAAWAVIPLVVMAVSAYVGEKTLIPRYFLVALPGWCVLAGVACAAATLAVRKRLGAVPALVTFLVPVLTVAVAGFQVQIDQRDRLGHGGGDVRPLVALLRSNAYRDAAVVVPKAYMVAQVEAYGPDLIGRMPLRQDPTPSAALVLVTTNRPAAVAKLRERTRVAVIAQGDATLATMLAAHIPGLGAPYRQTAVRSVDGWTLVTFDRSP